MSKFQSIFLNQQITCKNNYLNNKKWKIRISLEAWLKWQGIKVGMGRLQVRVLVGTRELLKEKRMRTQSSGNSGVVEMQMLCRTKIEFPAPPPPPPYPGRAPLPIRFHFRRFLLCTSGEEEGPAYHIITKLEKPSLDPVNAL